jgi:uncharacterized membrane protein YjgN (DUF898 family)
VTENELAYRWLGFRILTGLAAVSWAFALTIEPDAANPAVAFTLCWVVALPFLVRASMRRDRQP